MKFARNFLTIHFMTDLGRANPRLRSNTASSNSNINISSEYGIASGSGQGLAVSGSTLGMNSSNGKRRVSTSGGSEADVEDLNDMPNSKKLSNGMNSFPIPAYDNALSSGYEHEGLENENEDDGELDDFLGEDPELDSDDLEMGTLNDVQNSLNSKKGGSRRSQRKSHTKRRSKRAFPKLNQSVCFYSPSNLDERHRFPSFNN
jgi:hypothetical protein